MSLFTKIQTAITSNDAKQLSDIYHKDFEFVRHQTGTSLNKDEIIGLIQKKAAPGLAEAPGTKKRSESPV